MDNYIHIYLHENCIGIRNGLKHVTSNMRDPLARGCYGDNMRHIKVNTFDVWMCFDNLSNHPSCPTSDIHQRSHAAKSIFVFSQDNPHHDLGRTAIASLKILLNSGFFYAKSHISHPRAFLNAMPPSLTHWPRQCHGANCHIWFSINTIGARLCSASWKSHLDVCVNS
jgi:hypothetical protein